MIRRNRIAGRLNQPVDRELDSRGDSHSTPARKVTDEPIRFFILNVYGPL
jgi:hypothetical protein